MNFLQKASLRYAFCALVCRSRGLRRKSECGAAILLRLRRKEVSAYVMPTAPVGLRRMRELRNCHIKGNFVTETALSIGAVETNTLSGACAVQWVVSKNHDFFFHQFERKSVNI